jgi:DNA-binding beta-propeller fold protein YncE
MRSEAHRISLIAVIVLTLLTSSITYADDIYVSMGNEGEISKCDSSGNWSIFVHNLTIADGIVFDNKGNLYAADEWEGLIYKIDSKGNKTIFASGHDSDKPVGLAFDKNGNLFVSNAAIGTIDKIDLNGNRSLFASGLNLPLAISFDNNGNLFVSNRGNYSIEKFDSFGNRTLFASDIASNGLAFDSKNNLYATTGFLFDGAISKFDMNGNSTIFTTNLCYPQGIAFDSKDNVYVAENGNSQIDKFDPSGNRFFLGHVYNPYYIATQVPEPATLLLLGLGAAMLRKKARN